MVGQRINTSWVNEQVQVVRVRTAAPARAEPQLAPGDGGLLPARWRAGARGSGGVGGRLRRPFCLDRRGFLDWDWPMWARVPATNDDAGGQAESVGVCTACMAMIINRLRPSVRRPCRAWRRRGSSEGSAPRRWSRCSLSSCCRHRGCGRVAAAASGCCCRRPCSASWRCGTAPSARPGRRARPPRRRRRCSYRRWPLWMKPPV